GVSGLGHCRTTAGHALTASSEWHPPAAVTRSSSSPGPGSGTGTSTTSGALPTSRYCTARIAPPPSYRTPPGAAARIRWQPVFPPLTLGDPCAASRTGHRDPPAERSESPGNRPLLHL